MGSDVCEERGFQTFKQRFFPDVVCGKVGEYTRFHIASVIDMQVTSSTCNASVDKWCICPEIHDVNGFLVSEVLNKLTVSITLFRTGHEFSRFLRVTTNGH